jgi:small subunit ribosomal protein S4
MSRFTGPRVKRLRALNTELPGLTPKKFDKRPYPPGQHGQARKKLTEFALRLQEKQKLRLNYGVSESQLRRIVSEAKSAKGATGNVVIELLERRLDNVVFRAGLARTIPAARQLVNHGHVLINGKRVDIASYRIQKGEEITIHERSRKMASIAAGKEVAANFQTPWIDVNHETLTAKITGLPDETSILFPLNVQLVVEYYSQRL